MKTITIEAYEYNELSDEAKQKVLEDLYDINVNFDWWDDLYYDAGSIGLEIMGFDTYRKTIEGKLTKSLQNVCKNILDEHGKECETYILAKQWQHKHGEDNEEKFLKLLLEEYLKILRDEYEFLTGDKQIIETIEANEYLFTKDGSRKTYL